MYVLPNDRLILLSAPLRLGAGDNDAARWRSGSVQCACGVLIGECYRIEAADHHCGRVRCLHLHFKMELVAADYGCQRNG